jgi:4-hydroxy-tetrahydrodipicolinate reductase
MMHKQNAYQISMEEIHHTEKKDSPSGTAVTLAEGILKHYNQKTRWVNEPSSKENELEIISKRIDPAPGTHTIQYHSDIDNITLTHTAHSRRGFASGALQAAEFLYNKKGIYTMNDVLEL